MSDRLFKLGLGTVMAGIGGTILLSFDTSPFSAIVGCAIPGILMLIFLIALMEKSEKRPILDAYPLTSNRSKDSATFSDDQPLDKAPSAPLPHALKAMQIAHADQSALSEALLMDIGFIASWDEQSAYTYRTTAIPYTVKTVLPYAQLRLGYTGEWKFVYEIIDFSGGVLFKYEIKTNREAKRQLVAPSNTFFIPYEMRLSVWTLRLYVNDQLLAEHHFSWREKRIVQVDETIASDGELDEEMLLTARNAQPLSLDDLLAHGDDDAAKQA